MVCMFFLAAQGFTGIYGLFVKPQFAAGVTRMVMVCWRAGFAPVQPELSVTLTAENHLIPSTFRQPAKFSKHTC